QALAARQVALADAVVYGVARELQLAREFAHRQHFVGHDLVCVHLRLPRAPHQTESAGCDWATRGTTQIRDNHTSPGEESVHLPHPRLTLVFLPWCRCWKRRLFWLFLNDPSLTQHGHGDPRGFLELFHVLEFPFSHILPEQGVETLATDAERLRR